MVQWSAQYLTQRNVPNARLDAEYLLAHVLDCDRLALYLQFDRPLMPAELGTYKPLLLRRADREPLQYILGRTSFRELELTVDPRALIPRPETEQLVQAVLDWAAEAGRTDLAALDLGTGTGAIALSLALEGPFREIVAVDQSPEALALAQENNRTVRDSLTGVDDPNGTIDIPSSRIERPLAPVRFLEGNLFDPVDGMLFDVIVSNPPYVAEEERSVMEPEVLEFEPSDALFAGSDGLNLIRRILDEAPRHLRAGGLLAMEIGAEQGEAVLNLAGDVAGLTRARIHRDLSDRDRMVLAETE